MPEDFFVRVESGVDAGMQIPLPAGGEETVVLSLGRDRASNVCFSDQTMSRRQAELRWEGGAWHLLNLSQHGSYVGSRLLKAGKQRRLKLGDSITIGETKLRFDREADLEHNIHDTFTPRAPSVAAPPSRAGYDPEGQFHSGQTLMDLKYEAHGSFLYLLKNQDGEARLTLKTRRLYFLAVLALLGVLGAGLLFYRVLLPAYQSYPRGLLMATGLAFSPLIPYLLLFKALDRNDQIPWKNLLACAVWGGTIGCGFAILLNGMGHSTVAAFVGSGDAYTTTAVLIAPLVEEVTKGLAVLVLFWILHDEFDNLLEGLILGAASGLGFAVVENCIYNLRFLEEGQDTLWRLGGYRIVVNALIGHPIYTALTGAGFGLLRATPRKRWWRWTLPFLGFGAAIALHVSWNAAAIYLGGAFEDGGFLQLVTNALLLGGAGLAVFASAYVVAAKRERRVLVTYLVEEIEAGFVERAELDSFDEFLGRLRYEWIGIQRGGWKAWRLRKAMRRAQVELAFRKWHLAQGDAKQGASDVDDTIRMLRDQIRDARNSLNRIEDTPEALPPPPGAATRLPPEKPETELGAADRNPGL
jgi:RsiW-degrading membrane proteinase PrsW (M82 family)